MANSGVSVIICCYNSASRLPETLKHLALQKTGNIAWEIIIVDNASTDNTREVAAEFFSKCFNSQFGYKIVEEQTPGLSFARRRGCKESTYEYLLFCDDDNWLNEDYIQRAFQIMETNRNIGVVGGRGEAVSDATFPVWFASYQLIYAVGVQAINSGNISSKGSVWGSGMFLRKSILDKLFESGFKPLLSDRSGKLLSSGGDSEICKWFLIAGYQLWYDESLIFKHYISGEKLNKAYVERLHEAFELSFKVLNQYDYFIWHIADEKRYGVKHLFVTIYHILKYIFFKEKFSNLYLASKLPLKFCRLLDAKYYNIRIASYNYSTIKPNATE